MDEPTPLEDGLHHQEHPVHENLAATQEENHTESQTEQLTQNEFMTQNELTQLGDCEEDGMTPTPQSPVNPRSLPWGRLIPCSNENSSDNKEQGGRIDLFPRDPQPKGTIEGGCNFLGLTGLKPCDTFNEYVLGRSPNCDIVAVKPKLGKDESETEVALHKWAHGIISNRHCKIFCMLKTPAAQPLEMEVYVEDTSGNGTLVNDTTLLRRGERRLLHTGDEISLVNPAILRKKMRATESRTDLQRHHSFLFVNVYQQQGRHNHGAASTLQPQRLMPSPSTMMPPPDNKRRGLVNIRSTNNHSVEYENAQKPGAAKPASFVPLGNRREQKSNSRRVSPRRQQPRRIEEHYDIRDLLGSGTCGEVRRAIHRRTGRECAVKVIATKQNRSSLMLADSSALEAEAAMLQELDHPYIVKLIDVFVNPGTAVYLVMELLLGGDLFDRIISKGKYTEVDSRRVMRRLLSAIYYLHEERDIVHRDLKPENILCNNRTSDIDVKLTDFGLAKNMSGEGLKTFCGTPLYFAPEVLRRRHTVMGRGRYGKKADMFSLGVILYILLGGIQPFEGGLDLDAVVATVDFPQEAFESVSSEAKDLVTKLLQADPKDRLSVREACQHEWMLVDDGDTHTHPLDDPVLLARQPLLQPKMHQEEETETDSHNDTLAAEIEENDAAFSEQENQEQKEGPETTDTTLAEIKVAKQQAPRSDVSPRTLNQQVGPSEKDNGEDKENETNALKEGVVAGKETTKGETDATKEESLRSTLSPRTLNHQLENFRKVLAKSAGEKDTDIQRTAAPPLNVIAPSETPAKPLGTTSDVQNDSTMPLELVDDEICSQFSEDAEIDSISSFGTTSVEEKQTLERISSTSSSSVSEGKQAAARKKQPGRKRQNSKKQPQCKEPKKKKRRVAKAVVTSHSPSAAADETSIWKHVSGDEEQPRLVVVASSSGGRKNNNSSKASAAPRKKSGKKILTAATTKPSTQTTLASFFRAKRGAS